MNADQVHVSPAAGVSVYVGLGHAPFGESHTIALHPDHVAELGDAVTQASPPGQDAAQQATADVHGVAEQHMTQG